MIKKVKIGTKEFEMKSSAYTQFKYKNDTGRTLLKDIIKIGKAFNDLNGEFDIEQYDDLDDFITLSLRIAYIMCLEAKSISCSFEDFLMQVDDYLQDVNWISDVVELATSPFSGIVQTTKN